MLPLLSINPIRIDKVIPALSDQLTYSNDIYRAMYQNQCRDATSRVPILILPETVYKKRAPFEALFKKIDLTISG